MDIPHFSDFLGLFVGRTVICHLAKMVLLLIITEIQGWPYLCWCLFQRQLTHSLDFPSEYY